MASEASHITHEVIRAGGSSLACTRADLLVNYGFLAITISRCLENTNRIYCSIENLDAVILIHNSVHFFAKLGSVF